MEIMKKYVLVKIDPRISQEPVDNMYQNQENNTIN